MPKLTPDASKSSKRERMKTEMDKFKRGDLHSGSKTGPVVESRKQAIAIGLSESGQSKKDRVKKRKSSRGGHRNATRR
jgi:hypothetical protein